MRSFIRITVYLILINQVQRFPIIWTKSRLWIYSLQTVHYHFTSSHSLLLVLLVSTSFFRNKSVAKYSKFYESCFFIVFNQSSIFHLNIYIIAKCSIIKSIKKNYRMTVSMSWENWDFITEFSICWLYALPMVFFNFAGG